MLASSDEFTVLRSIALLRECTLLYEPRGQVSMPDKKMSQSTLNAEMPVLYHRRGVFVSSRGKNGGEESRVPRAESTSEENRPTVVMLAFMRTGVVQGDGDPVAAVRDGQVQSSSGGASWMAEYGDSGKPSD